MVLGVPKSLTGFDFLVGGLKGKGWFEMRHSFGAGREADRGDWEKPGSIIDVSLMGYEWFHAISR